MMPGAGAIYRAARPTQSKFRINKGGNILQIMFDQAREYIKSALYRLQHRHSDDEPSPVIIQDGVIVSEPPHDEEYDAHAETQRKQAERAAQYHQNAQALCAKNRREGIWIELMLLGVPISSIKPGVIDGNRLHYTYKGEPLSVIVPEWCLDLMKQDDISWHIERKGIHLALSRLDLKPEDIYTLSPPREAQPLL